MKCGYCPFSWALKFVMEIRYKSLPISNSIYFLPHSIIPCGIVSASLNKSNTLPFKMKTAFLLFMCIFYSVLVGSLVER